MLLYMFGRNLNVHVLHAVVAKRVQHAHVLDTNHTDYKGWLNMVDKNKYKKNIHSHTVTSLCNNHIYCHGITFVSYNLVEAIVRLTPEFEDDFILTTNFMI
uniref:Uncharacterized protein n=1 Tax=Arion vulgaris TaxID=1028688 RepID=A0A0B6ZTR2_9EUPU